MGVFDPSVEAEASDDEGSKVRTPKDGLERDCGCSEFSWRTEEQAEVGASSGA